MFPILGILLVFGAIAGGYLMEHGPLLVLIQPAELIIIFGAALSTVITANPLPTLIPAGKSDGGRACGQSCITECWLYKENLKDVGQVHDLFSLARKMGNAKLPKMRCR